MQKTRLTLQETLENLLGSKNVYYNPPETLKMEFPCIVYNRTGITETKADNVKYINHTIYKIIVLSSKPDHPVIKKILEIPMTRFSNQYVKNNFYHDVIILIQKEKQ